MTKIEPFSSGYKWGKWGLPILLWCMVHGAFAQTAGISMIDFVQIKNGKQAEALYFYENNWKVYRDMALTRGLIKSYKLLEATDTLSGFHLMLITEYADSAQWSASEKNFQKIISEISPNGPRLLNAFKPNDFRKNVFLRQTTTRFESDKKKKTKARKP